MQQIADVDVQMKEQTTVDVDSDLVLVTILVSGLSYFFFAVVATAVALAVVASDAEMTACGLSSYCSSAADVETAEAEIAADVDATTAATKINT